MREATFWILVLATVFAFVSYAVNKTLGKRDEVRAKQKKFNDHMKEMQDAMKRNDEAKLKELQAKDKEMNDAMMQTMFLPFRAFIIIIPAYLVLFGFSFESINFTGLLYSLFPNYAITLPFSLPARIDLWNADAWRPSFGVRGFFLWSTIAAGLIFVELIWTKVEARALGGITKLFKRGEPQKPSQ